SPRIAPRPATPKLVLDFDTPAAPTKVAPATSVDALGRARAAYGAGNRRLFAGDPGGAIRAYHQALAAYPGYVAGYRGLGLAYAQLGDKGKAMTAFQTYVNLVPRARDVGLIKKRIAALGT
ncbi:MAG: tetratricopeptide repeat protein, partial [Proteobacteria bacterium]|nr:tetratricopeptide repeat protein [Pseudomonadota bacterium]